MATKAVTDRQKSADSVVAIGETHAPQTGAAIVASLSSFLKEGEAMPDFALAMTLLTRKLAASKDDMVASDVAHEAELGDDTPVREARDSAAGDLYASLVELREVLTGLYGGETAAQVFSGSTPQDPVVLGRYAGEVCSALGRVTLPAPRVQGASLDAATVVTGLQAGASALDESIQAVVKEVREAQVTLDAKNKALAAYNETFGAVASALSGLLRIAGAPELAAKVRPSSRRPGRTAIEGGDAPTNEPK